ncbi:hypothetical protein [Solilutibacter silvestris]|uniref:Uncharacterized protein n=1 Tax=Solilutibacter silvestris TaxID=1645665 RepID=A0A2K1PYG1_9GAMM|nr:hypothetical protein [Lysobacter silvestris]PNS07826.1 hypothetical protein Lysil_2002 [Lysobacter silvestris]
MTMQMFTHWGRSMEGPELDLWVQVGQSVTERISLDIRELPAHPELIERMPETFRYRMLWEAREVGKGNFTLDPKFHGYDAREVGNASDELEMLSNMLAAKVRARAGKRPPLRVVGAQGE